MKILVFGATGRTGQLLVEQALASGHEVTAAARDSDKLGSLRERVRVVPGDVTNPDSLARAMNGQQAVLSALGVTGFLHSLRPMTFHEDSARAILSAMRRKEVRRFVGVTSVGVTHDSTMPLFYRWIVKPLLRHKYADMARMEEAVRTSGVEWVIVRPARLVDGPRTGHYRVGPEGTLPEVGRITRGDVADLMLKQATGDEYLHRAIAISE